MNQENNPEEVESYINSLYTEQHLEIMQCTYNLCKRKMIAKDRITKLVVTNPYTRGLKNLMLAFSAEDDIDKVSFFETAIKNLSHIKYYYLEAMYHYCIYLKDVNDIRYRQYLYEGTELSKKYFYQYQYHKFSNIDKSEEVSYTCDFDFYPNPNLRDYVLRYTDNWNKYFEKNKDVI